MPLFIKNGFRYIKNALRLYIMSKNFFTDVSLSQERALCYSLPDLLVESGTQLIQFAHNTQTQKYESQTTVDLEDTSSPPTSWELLALSDSIIVGKNIESRPNQEKTDQSQSKVIKLSQSLEQLKVYGCGDVAAMATDGNYIFVCTDGKLVALNQDLETLDEVDLALQGLGWRKKKNAHDILIDKSIAYLLDNIVFPTYILRVDISNPSHLQILTTFDITGVNHHLRGQWINPELKQWCILRYYGTQAGSGENIIILPLDLDSGSVDLSSSHIQRSYFQEGKILGYESISYASFGGSEKSGFDLIAVTSFPPIWGLIHDEQERLYLAKIKTFNNRIKLQDKLYLGELKHCHYPKGKITPIGKLLFLVIQGHTNQRLFTRLLIIDVAQKPSIILNQNLEVQSLYGSTMSYLLLPQNN
ncbi:MAG: hypothetical protein ACOVQ7_20390 [Limnoraphis robusta]